MFNLMDLMTTLVIYIQSINQSINQCVCMNMYLSIHIPETLEQKINLKSICIQEDMEEKREGKN